MSWLVMGRAECRLIQHSYTHLAFRKHLSISCCCPEMRRMHDRNLLLILLCRPSPINPLPEGMALPLPCFTPVAGGRLPSQNIQFFGASPALTPPLCDCDNELCAGGLPAEAKLFTCKLGSPDLLPLRLSLFWLSVAFFFRLPSHNIIYHTELKLKVVQAVQEVPTPSQLGDCFLPGESGGKVGWLALLQC